MPSKSTNTHGGRRDNRKRRPDDKRGGRRIPGPGKKLGRPRKEQTMIEYFQVTPIAIDGYADANGVYVNRLGAWVGDVRDTFVEPYADEDGDYIPAPDNWRELIVRNFN